MTTPALSEDEKERIRQVYTKSRDNTISHDIRYVAKLKPAVFDRLLSHSDPTVQRLGAYALHLQRFIGDHLSGAYSAPIHIIHAFTAVLLYLVNPFDVIQDGSSARGYADDIFVLELGLADGGEELRKHAGNMGLTLP